MSDLLKQLWRAAGEDRRATLPVTIDPQLLLQAHAEIVRLGHHFASTTRRGDEAEHERHQLRVQSGALQVENARLRYRLAAALELAEDRGVLITDEEIAEHIAASRQVKDDDEGPTRKRRAA